MSGKMTDERREAMGWRLVQGLIGPTWVHASYGLRRWSVDVPDIIVPLQEEIARLKAELAELRKIEAPKEWAAGQVWRWLNVSTFLVVRTELGSYLSLNIDSETGRPCASDGIVVLLTSDPCAKSTYLGQYADLYSEAK